jgi:branched-chain amino acid transport system ATP-binding protein
MTDTSASERLEVTGLSAGYGPIRVVFDVSFSVAPGELVAMVGRNGAGKSTSLLAVAGVRQGPGEGRVAIGGTDLSTASPNDRLLAGVKLVPEGRRIFREMTVIENLRLGAFSRRKDTSRLSDDLDHVFHLFPILQEFQKRVVSSLSGGQQQMVAIGQALMSRPRFLLLDEPCAGLAPVLIDAMYDTFTSLAAEGIGILLVDQNIERVLELAGRFYVLEGGRTALDGLSSAPGVLENVTSIVLGSDRQRTMALHDAGAAVPGDAA